jgi:hypothetical protein
MENNILGGLTGLPPNIPTNYWTPKEGEKATLNEKLLSVNKLNPKPTPIEVVGAMKTYIVNEDIVSPPIPIFNYSLNIYAILQESKLFHPLFDYFPEGPPQFLAMPRHCRLGYAPTRFFRRYF